MTSRRWIAIIILFGISLVLNQTLMPAINIGGVSANLMIFFVVFLALSADLAPAVLIGALIGLCEDLFIGRYIGLSVISYGIVAYLVARFKNRFYHENLLAPIVIIFCASLIYGLIYALCSNVVGLNLPVGGTFIRYILPQALYNALITLIIYIPLRLVSDRSQAAGENRRYHYHKRMK